MPSLRTDEHRPHEHMELRGRQNTHLYDDDTNLPPCVLMSTGLLVRMTNPHRAAGRGRLNTHQYVEGQSSGVRTVRADRPG